MVKAWQEDEAVVAAAARHRIIATSAAQGILFDGKDVVVATKNQIISCRAIVQNTHGSIASNKAESVVKKPK